ncbi:hypothetical protein Acr_08g0016540 [Actinidia rufa]|uniref:Uncharacterized protein n=2 Tax=Actinidia TaxID=3624 RepID=A0A7J0F3I8_9ERIC|nr:hypothetical protein Acr_08g0016540 [Actinidia rufa]
MLLGKGGAVVAGRGAVVMSGALGLGAVVSLSLPDTGTIGGECPPVIHTQLEARGGKNATILIGALRRMRRSRLVNCQSERESSKQRERLMRKFDPWPVFFRREWSRNWPFLVGFAVTGTIITKLSLGLTEEDAKNSPFVQRHKRHVPQHLEVQGAARHNHFDAACTSCDSHICSSRNSDLITVADLIPIALART